VIFILDNTIYLCLECNESWETDTEGHLLPGIIKSGYWKRNTIKSALCPACFIYLEDISDYWIWVERERVY
jgi:hypothetical protein